MNGYVLKIVEMRSGVYTFSVGAVVHLLEAKADCVLAGRDALVLFKERLVETLG